MPKSRHYRGESDALLGLYSEAINESTSVRRAPNPLYSSVPLSVPLNPSPEKRDSNRVSPLRSSLNASLRLFRSDSEHFDDPQQNMRGYRVHRVSYTAQNHVQVLFQMYGSAFPNVLPFCVVNVLWTLAVQHLKIHNVLDLTFHSSVGHSFMGLLVSFLIVSRSKISYDRFMDFRRLLATTYRTCREIAQFTTVYTFQTQTPEARAWRQQVCFRTIVLLRVTMDALLWSSTERERWEEEYFRYQKRSKRHKDNNNNKRKGHARTNSKLFEDLEEGEDDNVSEHFFRMRKLTHGRRSMVDENFRAPITFCHVLKQTIMTHPEALGYKMAVNEYRDLLNFVTQFQQAFHGFRVLIFTPYPFPLVQMTRAFLFFWVYTLPLVLLKDYRLWSSILIVLLVTFGFVGIEYVSMALDDPFGDDTNDVDEHGMALLVYEDIYLAIYRTDGPEAAMALRDRILKRYKQGRGLDCYRDDLKGYEIWEPLYYPSYPQQQQDDTCTEPDEEAPTAPSTPPKKEAKKL